jgi:hypothetical protein
MLSTSSVTNIRTGSLDSCVRYGCSCCSHAQTWLVQKLDCGNLLFVGSIEADDIYIRFV